MEDFFENELIKKFEDMIENHDELYFDSEEIEQIIVYYLELGDISYAERAVHHGLSIHPNSIDIKIKYLEVLLELEDYTTARKLINELQENSQESTDFLVCCAKYYSNLGNSKKAIALCEKALQLGEELNFLHNFIADECINIGEPFRALSHYQKALHEDPEDDYALENCMRCFAELKKPKDALLFLNDYLDRFPYSETAWYEMGQFYFNRKEYKKAINAFDYLLAINSNAVGVYTNKATCYEALKDYEKAIEIYEEVLEIEFTKAYTYHRIGLCYRALNKPIIALKYFQKSLIEDPQYYPAMMEQSFVYEALHAMEEALHFAKEATMLNEGNLEYQKRLAYLYIERSRFDEGAICLKKIVDAEPNRFYNWYAYIEVLMLLEEYEEAIRTLSIGLKRHKRAELYYQLSHCHFQLNQNQLAQEALQKAIALDESLMGEMQKKYPSIREKKN